MPSNWIRHAISSTPVHLTEEDLAQVDEGKIHEFFQSVKFLALIRHAFPADLYAALRQCHSSEFSHVLVKAVSSGSFMETGWVDEYFHSCEEVSFRMRGYPRMCRSQWRSLREAASLNGCNHFPSQVHDTQSSTPGLVSQKSKSDHFRFLDLPSEVRNRIYRLLLYRDPVVVGDWNVTSVSPALFRRTEYEVVVAGSQWPRRTTYTVRHDGKRMSLSIMQVNRKIHDEASRIFYSENTFKLLGNYQTTKSGPSG